MKLKYLILLVALLLIGVGRVAAQEITEEELLPADSLVLPASSVQKKPITVLTTAPQEKPTKTTTLSFVPDPQKALWYSVLCPGLGQIYNRRYWKLPIVVGGFMGLAYGMSWNNRYLEDYTIAYLDIMDSDPSTNSYMNFLPSSTTEESLDKEWLKGVLKRKKDYFRRNRDLCIISMVGLYLLCMVDAYVDAQLFQFDISPGIAMEIKPSITAPTMGLPPSAGVQWAINF